MGVDARLAVYAPDQSSAERACEAAFARIAALDASMSDYRRDSELNRLCARAGGPPVRLSPDLYRVLDRAQQIARRSGGAFDVTAGPLVALWRGARKSGTLPAAGELREARRLTGWRKLRLDPRARAARLETAGMRLDLGGIAKGYAADAALAALRGHGVTRALVELGGDIVLGAPPPGASGWKIRVPNADRGRGPAEMLLAGRAVSTSGDTEQFAVIGGRRYSHVVDPRTGMALTSRVQVTVTARDGFTSDPLATAMSVLARAEGEALLKAYPGTEAFTRVERGAGAPAPSPPAAPAPPELAPARP